MYPLIKQTHRYPPLPLSLPYHSNLIDHCFSLKSWKLSTIVHAQLIKVGFNSYTFLGNRCLDLYTQFGTVNDFSKVFCDISIKNKFSWNIFLKGLLKCGDFGRACSVFDEMPERDVVSWNSLISGFAAFGHFGFALGIFGEMQSLAVRPSEFRYSIMMSIVCSARHGKELHGSLIRSALSGTNLVIGNSLIDMYSKLGALDYACRVFSSMQVLDVISWNSLITGCCKSGHEELALNQFHLMRSSGYSPDQFTFSAVIAACSNLRELEEGKEMFALSIKMGFLCNDIISSAIIDLFSKCNRLEDSVRFFGEQEEWNSSLFNSMISGYAWHGFGEDALQLFVLGFRENVRPTEFTLSSILSSTPFLPVEQGTQIHSLVIKSGFELDDIVASSLMDMYSKFGIIDYSMSIFNKMVVRDLISWNTIIVGLTLNGRVFEALNTSMELLREGPPPDGITVAGILLACSYGGFADEGLALFLSMEERYGIKPMNEHYKCLVDLLCRVGRIQEAMHIAESMPYKASTLIWESILHACLVHEDVKLIEKVAERLMELGLQSYLSYLILAQLYEARGQWESIVRVVQMMKRNGVKDMVGCSWIGIKNRVHAFKADELQQHGGTDIYLVSRLLNWDMEDEGYFCPYCGGHGILE